MYFDVHMLMLWLSIRLGFCFFFFSFSYENLIKDEARNKHLESALQQALKEAADDQTFRKVKRLSYSANDTDEVSALRK